MISIKEYADKQGITIQAVYQSLNRKNNKIALQGHVKNINGKKMLDDIAVEILDESRKQSHVVIKQEENTELIEELTNQNEKLKLKVYELQDRLIEKQDVIQEVQNKLIQARENESLLIARQEDINALKTQLDSMQHELEQEKSKTWWDKLLKKR